MGTLGWNLARRPSPNLTNPDAQHPERRLLGTRKGPARRGIRGPSRAWADSGNSGHARLVGLAAVVRRNPLSLLELGASLGPDHGCTLESPFQNSVVRSASWGGGRRPCSKRGSGSPRSPTTSRAQRVCAGERTVPAAPLAYALIVDRGPSPAPVVAARQGGCGRRVVGYGSCGRQCFRALERSGSA